MFSFRNSNDKYLMTGPKGNSEFCFPETLNVSRGEAKGNLEVIKCFGIPPNSNLEKNCEEIVCFTGWLTNLARFQEARPDHVQVDSSCCCFPRELVSFDPRHVTRSPPNRETYSS